MSKLTRQLTMPSDQMRAVIQCKFDFSKDF